MRHKDVNFALLCTYGISLAASYFLLFIHRPDLFFSELSTGFSILAVIIVIRIISRKWRFQLSPETELPQTALLIIILPILVCWLGLLGAFIYPSVFLLSQLLPICLAGFGDQLFACVLHARG